METLIVSCMTVQALKYWCIGPALRTLPDTPSDALDALDAFGRYLRLVGSKTDRTLTGRHRTHIGRQPRTFFGRPSDAQDAPDNQGSSVRLIDE